MQGRASTARRGIARWIAAVAASVVVAPAAAAAETYTVTSPADDGTCSGTTCSSLRAALATAQDGDTIRLPDHGRPYEQGGQQGEFVVTRDLAIVGDGADRTVIEGGNDRVFVVTAPKGGAPPAVVMSHLQVADGDLSFGAGGNILNYGDLTLDHVRVTGGRAYRGGGVANVYGNLVVRHSVIDGNFATYSESGADGGGIYSETGDNGGSLLVHDSTIAFNEAQRGAGIAVRFDGESQPLGRTRLDRVTLARNLAYQSSPGGLLIADAANMVVSGSLIADNTTEPPQRLARGVIVAPQPSNCDPFGRPVDGGGNLSNTDDCGFKNPPADPSLSDDLQPGFGETPLLMIPSHSPAVDLAGECQGTDQRDLQRPQGPACDAGAFEVASEIPAPPEIESGPTGTTSAGSATFEFSSEQPDTTFECRLDGPAGEGRWEPCTSPRTYASLANGSYTFYVRAAGGQPASRAFSVAAPVAQPQPAPPPPAVAAQTPAPTPTATPQPVFRKSVSVKPTKGTVKVKLPGTNRYVNLESLDTIPFGASIDVRKGRVRLYAARNGRGELQAASFYSGVFRVVQRGSYIELQLRGPKPVCGSGKASASTYKPKKKKARKRRLWGSGKGRFRTHGQYSAATVRGTKWLVEDSCRSTTTRVKSGVVTVRDFKRKKTITLRAGDRYVARKRYARR
jgi:hypothetical protein